MDKIEEIIQNIREQTFHMDDELAIPVIDKFIADYPILLDYHDKEWYYKNC